MRTEEKWIVRIHDDNVNTFPGVTLVLEELLGWPVDACWATAERVHTTGSADLEPPVSAADAENVVAALQIRGLRATLRSVG
ncbi:ATP-dependent Clp protease adaptor ClpS [Amycolatopsis sp. NPDC048633]|uniref:ATP-dependent Clp protease adaptor ClpS n=1 Tax=Amycolatopsis sp. NPDC048633 TaxID=3157095 RepID=UPI0033FA41B1